MFVYPQSESIPVGIVIRKSPGVTRWAQWAWQAVGVLPGAGPADWKMLRSEDNVTEYHAATRDLTLYVSDAEAYVHELGTRQPSVYVVMRRDGTASDTPLNVVLITASPYEAQDYEDSGEEIVEKVQMPVGMLAWVRDFVERHYEEEAFVKRRRNKNRVDGKEDGIGDPRIAQTSDVYRAPTSKKEVAQ
ncbi:DUF3305 domain-containing protein [Litoreibacter janthinus]|uniref:Molybdopterin-guanine dinucleotide biosynthesis protein A n=1 Tax=Litoreibacter janthinus TaxID=670154 RepID=A0A1I6ID17_9RHOB|nr:DUF3305 domain-containing protein [Litoreibacter janthinus]SFR64250.1 Protein of unknown function [Litoreibacter janthinus]